MKVELQRVPWPLVGLAQLAERKRPPPGPVGEIAERHGLIVLSSGLPSSFEFLDPSCALYGRAQFTKEDDRRWPTDEEKIGAVARVVFQACMGGRPPEAELRCGE